jgi:hypothetical protein
MRSSHRRGVAIAVFVFALTFSPYAHAADASAFGINGPFADEIQLLSTMLTSLDSFSHRIASALQLHDALKFNRTAPSRASKNLQQPAALAASAALATESSPETATTSGSVSGTPGTPPGSASDQATQSPFVKSPESSQSPEFSPIISAYPQTLAVATPASTFPNQQMMNAKLLELDNTLAAEIQAVSSNVVGAYQAASYVVPPAAITGETFTGGTISSLAVSGTGTSTFAGGINLSGGCVAVNGTCISGGGGGSGTVGSGTQGQFAFYNANGATVVSLSRAKRQHRHQHDDAFTTPDRLRQWAIRKSCVDRKLFERGWKFCRRLYARPFCTDDR